MEELITHFGNTHKPLCRLHFLTKGMEDWQQKQAENVVKTGGRMGSLLSQ